MVITPKALRLCYEKDRKCRQTHIDNSGFSYNNRGVSMCLDGDGDS